MKYAVYMLLLEKSPEIAEVFNSNYFEVTDLDETGQIRHINNYLRQVLGLLPVSTIQARTCLDDNLSKDRWLTYFTNNVLPVLLEHGI